MSIQINGLEALGKHFENAMQLALAKKAVKLNGSELNKRMQGNANFVKGYSTGTTKRSITTDLRDDGLTVAVKPNTRYAGYVEHGTRKMSAQPFIRPAFDGQKGQFLDDIRRVMS